jgi:hypothetical protein
VRAVVSHSLHAETAVLPFENPDEFNALRQLLRGARELFLFDEIVTAAWRLQRLRNPSTLDLIGAMLVEDAQGKRVLAYIARMESAQRRAYREAVRELERLQALRHAQRPQAPQSAAASATASAEAPAPKLASVVQQTPNPPNSIKPSTWEPGNPNRRL